MKEILLGRTVREWIEIERVLSANDIGDAVTLQNRLGFNRVRSLNVYDYANEKRLLGVLRNPPSIGNGHTAMFLECVIPPGPASVGKFDPNMDMMLNLYRVRFDIRFNDRSEDGFERRATLHTDTPLDKLMQLENFRLPGESERQFYERYRNRY
jgi:hypothetical protein